MFNLKSLLAVLKLKCCFFKSRVMNTCVYCNGKGEMHTEMTPRKEDGEVICHLVGKSCLDCANKMLKVGIEEDLITHIEFEVDDEEFFEDDDDDCTAA